MIGALRCNCRLQVVDKWGIFTLLVPESDCPSQYLSMWPSKRKLDEEESKHASLAWQNGFGPTFFHRMLRLSKGTAESNSCC
jgi:hypothetical protein